MWGKGKGSGYNTAPCPLTTVSHIQPTSVTLTHSLSSRPAYLAQIPIGLGHAGGPVLAGPGLAWVHPVLAHTALESSGTVTEIGGAAVNAEASILAQERDFSAWGERQTGTDKAKWGGRMLRPQALSRADCGDYY